MNRNPLRPGALRRSYRRTSVIAVLALTASLGITLPATADPSPSPSPTPTPSTSPDPVDAAKLEAKKQNKRVEIESYRSETSTTYANTDGKTLYTELWSTPIRVKKDGAWQSIDTTLVEEGGAVRPKVIKGDLTLSPGGDVTLAKTTNEKGKASVFAPGKLPKPELAGDTATYRSAYGKGIDLVAVATPTGFRQEIVIRERPIDKLKLRIPVGLPKGMSYGKDSSGKPALLTDKGKKTIAPIAGALMLDAVAVEKPEAGRSGAAAATVEQTSEGSAVVLAPDPGFLADPSVTYPVTMAVASDDWTGTGIDGDTFVNNAAYPNGASNNSLSRILVGKSNSGTVTWRGYIRFNIKGTPLEGGTVINSDLRLWNYRSNLCQSQIDSGIVARRVTSNWDMSTLTWSNQPSVTTSGQVGNKGAYTDDCSRGEGELYYSIEQMVQNWMDGQPDYGVRLSSVSESDLTNWRWYRSSEYGGYDDSPGNPRGPVLFINYEPAPTLPEPISWFKPGEGFPEDATDEEIRAATHSSDTPVDADEISAEDADAMQADAPEFFEDLGRVLARPSDVSEEAWNSLNPNVSDPDPDVPEVVSNFPASGSVDVATDVQVQVRFSEPVADAQITITDRTGVAVPGSTTANAAGDGLIFTPSTPLTQDALHTVEVSGAKDADGHVMASPHTWTFVTAHTAPEPTPTPSASPSPSGADPDTTPPSVREVSPTDGASGVATDSTVTVRFSEPVTGARITVFDAWVGANVPGSAVMSADNTVLTFTPSEPLFGLFDAEISGAKDAAGNTMATYSWSFTTWDFASARRSSTGASEKAASSSGPQAAAVAEPFPYDRITSPSDCRALSGPKAYAVKNSYNWCMWGEIGSRTRFFENGREVGWVKYTARVTLIAHSYTGNANNDQARDYAQLKSRQFKIWFYLDEIDRKGGGHPAATVGAATYPFTLGLGFKPNGCSVAPVTLDGFVYKTIEGWRDEGGEFTFTSDPAAFAAPDRIGQCSLRPQMYFKEQIAEPYGYPMNESPVFRCDSSPMITTSKGGCVVWKNGRPVFQLSKSAQVKGPGGTLMTNPVQESAQHIYDAWNNPAITFPLANNKQIPGFDWAHAIERNTDTSRKGLGGQNRKVAIRQCDVSFSDPRPRPPGVRYTKKRRDSNNNIIVRSCDEFPFAATHQGAFLAGTNYSARAILATDNCTSGSWLGWWFERNRVLEKQKFTVKILDTQDPGVNGNYPPPVASCTSDESIVPDSEAP